MKHSVIFETDREEQIWSDFKKKEDKRTIDVMKDSSKSAVSLLVSFLIGITTGIVGTLYVTGVI